MSEYLKIVKAYEVAGTMFGDGMFRIKGKRAFYDEVWIADGGIAFYLCRLWAEEDGLHSTKRWIDPETELEQLYGVDEYGKVVR